MRLLRGEPLDAVSRESQVPAHELEGWKRVFLEAGGRGLKSPSDPEGRELTLARAKVGGLTMRLELAEYLIKNGAQGRLEEAQGMRAHVSPSTGRRYRLTLICQVFRVPRSSVYAAQAPRVPADPPGKRGPKTRWVDADLVAGIHAILAASPFHGEGYDRPDVMWGTTTSG